VHENTVSSTTEYSSRSEDPGKSRNMSKLSASVYNVLFSMFSVSHNCSVGYLPLRYAYYFRVFVCLKLNGILVIMCHISRCSEQEYELIHHSTNAPSTGVLISP
jgi:hypothetical protein